MKTARSLFFKLVLLLPLLIFFIVFLKSPVHAADNPPPPTNNQYLTPNTNPDVPKNMHTYTQSIVIELLSSAYCQLSGYDPISKDHRCLGIDQGTGKIGFVENGGGAVGVMGNLIAATFVPPTSSSQYINYMAGNFGFPKKAYAQSACADGDNGVGFCSLGPVTNIWVAMRNIVYLLFTVIFIIIGVAIMLRVHIDPRTVMTIENQIPKIIVGILLVSFSLAIAGLLIDLMYVAIYLIGSVLGSITDSAGNALLEISKYNQAARTQNPFDALGTLDGFGSITFNVSSAISNMLSQTGILPTFEILGTDIINALAVIIVGLIVFIALLYALIRVWITLIIAYISLLLDIVFAPFWFIAGLLPGSSLGVGAWFRDVIANLAVFPATVAMFALGIIFSRIGTNNTDYLFNPPLVGGIGTSTLGGLIMFGFIFMTPHVLTTMKAAIKAPKLNFGPVLEPLRVGAGGPRRGIQGGVSYLTNPKYEIGPGGGTKDISKTRRAARAFGFGRF